MLKNNDTKVKGVLEATYHAGEELAAGENISNESLSQLSQELMPRDKYIEMINRNFKNNIGDD